MVEPHWLHFGWFLSHLVRTAAQDRRQWELVEKLSTELSVLQAEVHRAHRLISGYTELVERCESHQGLRERGNFWFLVILVALTLLLSWSWRKGNPNRIKAALEAGDTGGSSDSDTPPNAVVKKVFTGPARPSHFVGKGKK